MYLVLFNRRKVMTMTDKEIIREAMNARGWSQERLAQESGFKSQSNITGIINRGKKSVKVDTLFRLLDAMGYEILVVDKFDRKKTPLKVSFPKDYEE